MKLTFTAAGDILMPRPIPCYEGFADVAGYIRSAPARLANLEAVISDYDCFPSTFSGGTWVNAVPKTLQSVKDFGFNMLGCANNHSMDYSFGGLLSTIKNLKKEDLAFAGIGANLQEACAPVFLELQEGKIALLDVTTTIDDSARAGVQGPYIPARPGANVLRADTVYSVTSEHMMALREIASCTHINGRRDKAKKNGFHADIPGEFYFDGLRFREGEKDEKITTCNKVDLKRILDAVAQAKEIADYVVIMAHSHQIKKDEHHEPDDFFVEFCRACIDAGACAVIGSGVHELRPIEIYRGKPIFYSLGNFVFQSGLVEYLPPDFMEKYGLPADASAEEALLARSKGGRLGLHTDIKNYRTIVPRITFEEGELTELLMLPTELGFDLEPEYKGLPKKAEAQEAEAILQTLSELSRPYGTELKLSGGLIELK